MQRRVVRFWIAGLAALTAQACRETPEREEPAASETAGAGKYRRLSLEEYADKMRAGWIGQMAGVGWGGPTEFRWKGQVIPEEEMPRWEPEMINQFQQDDLYVEMTFLGTLERDGLGVSLRQAGIDFANSGYPLWHANRAGRDNLRSGIAPPDSGHPRFNGHADDIDYQIEADFSGLIAPGLPNTAIALGEVFGRLMNYGDGLYGGQFVGGMYAEAFFADDPVRIVEAGLACIPPQSQYAETIRDVLRWHRENPDDWERTWRLVDGKYHRNPAYRRASCSGPESDFNIDAKLNGAYIALGLLYGKRDPDRTIIIATRCGQDSDCNPSNAAGVLFTTIGFSRLPERFTSALDPEGKFSHTPYTFPRLVAVSKKLAREAVVRAGGRIERGAGGEEVLVIPGAAPRPSPLEACWEPGPAAGSRYSEEEMARITARAGVDLSAAISRFAPGWTVARCGPDMDPGLREEWGGRRNVLVTHPLSPTAACVISRDLDVPPGKAVVLRLAVGHDPRGDWVLVVKAAGEEVLSRPVGPETAAGGWLELEVPLPVLGGETARVELLNGASGWSFEAAYWGKIEVEVR